MRPPLRRGLLICALVACTLTLGAGEAEAWRRRRGFRSSRPITKVDVCCLLPVLAVVVLFGGVGKAHRRSQHFSSMHRHRRW